MRRYVLIGCGTFGKTVVLQAGRLRTLYGREPIPSAMFDSYPGHSLPPFVLPEDDPPQVDVSIDGQDLRQALARGEYPRLAALDPELLKQTKLHAGFSLYPPLGLAAATLHRRTIREAVRRLCQTASDIRSDRTGELVVIRCFSSCGGTSRGPAWEIGEALLDVGRETGLRIHLLDLVAIPGLGSSTSELNRQYLGNTLAFVKETAALRSEAFHRIVWDERGRAVGTRNGVLPSTLVIVSDTGAEGHSLPLDLQAAMLARFIDLLTVPAFSEAFWGTYVDLIRHETTEPYAARLGFYSLFVPTREETIARRYEVLGRAVDLMLQDGADPRALAQDFLARLGLWAPTTSTLKVLHEAREQLVERVGDPVHAFRNLFTPNPGDFFDDYRRIVEDLRGFDPDGLGRELAESLAKRGTLEDELNQLPAMLLPGRLLAVLRQAVALLEEERDELAAALDGPTEERIQEEEQAASNALESYRSLRGGAWSGWRFGHRRRWLEDARDEVKAHLAAALGRRVEFLLLRAFVTLLDRLIGDIQSGTIPGWATVFREAEAFTATLARLREEFASREALVRSGGSVHRGPATRVTRRAAAGAAPQPEPERIVDTVRPLVPGLYAASTDAAAREMRAALWQAVDRAIPWTAEPLEAASLSDHELGQVAVKAAPLSPVDATLGSGLRARFVVAPGGESSALKARATRAFAGALPADREPWIDAGPDHADEFIVMTFEEGVPLRAFKGLHRTHEVSGAAAGRARGHLEPLFALLPDPVAPVLTSEELVVLGRLTGAVEPNGTDLLYVDTEGFRRPLGDVAYEVAVSIISRLIARVRTEGFAGVIDEAKRLAAGSDDGPAARVAEALRRTAEDYHRLLDPEQRR